MTLSFLKKFCFTSIITSFDVPCLDFMLKGQKSLTFMATRPKKGPNIAEFSDKKKAINNESEFRISLKNGFIGRIFLGVE